MKKEEILWVDSIEKREERNKETPHHYMNAFQVPRASSCSRQEDKAQKDRLAGWGFSWEGRGAI